MAGIIAQLTRSARERGNKKYYGANKCLYTLHRFDPNGFDPLVHNRFVAERTRLALKPLPYKTRMINYIQELELEENDERRQKTMEFRWLTCLMESIMILTLLGLIPAYFILAEILFNFGTRYLSEDCLESLYRNDRMMIVYSCNFTAEDTR